MSRTNPYEKNFDQYVEEYNGPYSINKSTPIRIEFEKEIPSVDTVKGKTESVVAKTVDTVKDKTESVIEEITGSETLSDKSHKKSLSVVDYAILLSSVYGIGAAVGITTAAGKNIVPEPKEKPILYWSMIGLGLFGAIKGFKTVSDYKSLRMELQKQSKLEKIIEDKMKNR